MNGELALRFALAFAWTQLVEIPIYLRPLGGRPRGWLVAFGASAWTHPIVALAIPRLLPPVAYAPGFTTIDAPFLARAALLVVVAEGFAVAGEALWLRAFGVPRPLRWSLLANAASAGTGAVLTWVTGWP